MAADRSAALFAFVQAEANREMRPRPLRLVGLDPDHGYEVRRVRLGDDDLDARDPPPLWLGAPGVFTGCQLAVHGPAMPVLYPEHVLLLECGSAGVGERGSARRGEGQSGAGAG